MTGGSSAPRALFFLEVEAKLIAPIRTTITPEMEESTVLLARERAAADYEEADFTVRNKELEGACGKLRNTEVSRRAPYGGLKDDPDREGIQAEFATTERDHEGKRRSIRGSLADRQLQRSGDFIRQGFPRLKRLARQHRKRH